MLRCQRQRNADLTRRHAAAAGLQKTSPLQMGREGENTHVVGCLRLLANHMEKNHQSRLMKAATHKEGNLKKKKPHRQAKGTKLLP